VNKIQNIYHQLITTKRLANRLSNDPEYMEEVGLGGFDHTMRLHVLRQVVGFIIAMYTHYCCIFRSGQIQDEDEKWAHLILSRTRLTVFGEKDINGATDRLRNWKLDLQSIGTSWDEQTVEEKFIGVCATCDAIESYEQMPSGTPTMVCKMQYDLLIPRVLSEMSLNLG